VGNQTLVVGGPTQIYAGQGHNSVGNGVLGVGDVAPQPNNIIFADGSVTLPAGGNGTGILSALNVYPGVSSSDEIDASGLAGQVYWNGTGSNNPVGFVIGGNFQATLQGTSGLLGHMTGTRQAAVSVSPGVITNAWGGEFNIVNEGGGTMTTAVAGMFDGGNSGNSSIGTWYGGYFANPSIGGGIGTSYGIYLESQTGATNNYSIYSAGGKSYFGGPIGLGVAAPTCTGATKTCMLAVAGAISSQEVIVTTSGADYVFDPSYRLAPLTEVADYIEANHHLPEIPAASDMSQNGVSVGDLQSKLLAKIEELTLHMIEAEKENRQLRERVAKLEAGAADKSR
jgi:hypothetical protein